ncbi:MAG: RNA methyltransferase [Bacteroidales bacterium]|nr:RNA methyltransferase [Bacteroidales bacterium]
MQPTEKLLEYLLCFVSEHKKQRFDQVLSYRTRHLTLVLENVFQPHNASAVLRSCDCFGIQDVHIIENTNTYEVNPNIALGSSKWLTLHKYNTQAINTRECLLSLKKAGYTLVATSPHHFDFSLINLPLQPKTAILLGTELNGLSEEAFQMADYTLNIPMFGFTESFNVSVSASLILYELTKRLQASDISWQLSPSDRLDILLSWARNTVRKSDVLEKNFLNHLKSTKSE